MKFIKKLHNFLFQFFDRFYINIDRSHVRRTKNIKYIPGFRKRRGGKQSYAEWAHVIGIFQTLIYQTISKKTGNYILDIGCGTGLLGISSDPFISENGKYTGIDVIKKDINYCKNHFNTGNIHEFIHFDVHNETYAKTQSKDKKEWPIENELYDLVTALSVWTHLNQDDALFYLKEISRVLKKNGKAIITFFYLDDLYKKSIEQRDNKIGRYHSTSQQKWIFDNNAYNSKNWFYPKWVKNPEDAIGINKTGLDILLKESGLKLIKYYPGNWKEQPGVYFQDILVFQK